MSLHETHAPLAGRPVATVRPRRTVWDPARTPLVCTAVRDETRTVKTFSLAPDDGARMVFDAGQHLTLEWRDAAGVRHTPTFTIASPPSRAKTVELTVKAHRPDGVAADLHARLSPGVAVRAHGPGGRFTLPVAAARAAATGGRLLFVGGGSGITPLMAMLRLIRARHHQLDVAAILTASTPADLLFADELAELSAATPGAAIHIVVSRVPAGERWVGLRGRLNRRLLTTLVPDARARTPLLCGPDGFMAAVTRALGAEGVAADQILTERFHAAPAGTAAADAPAAATSGASITLARSGRTITARPGETVAAALARAGRPVPTGCGEGLCGTCRLQCVSGEVSMAHRGGIDPREEAAGTLLACSAWPTGPIVLDW